MVSLGLPGLPGLTVMLGVYPPIVIEPEGLEGVGSWLLMLMVPEGCPGSCPVTVI